MTFPPSMWVNTKGEGGETIAKDIQERGQARSRDKRPPLRRWEKVVMGLVTLVSLGYLIFDKLL